MGKIRQKSNLKANSKTSQKESQKAKLKLSLKFEAVAAAVHLASFSRIASKFENRPLLARLAGCFKKARFSGELSSFQKERLSMPTATRL